jgi:predicted nucleic acid-binding protein
MAKYLLDTNALSAILEKRDADAQKKLTGVLMQNADILISPIVYYKIARGLRWSNAQKQLLFLKEFITDCTWCDLNRDTWEMGAQFWAKCRREGKPTSAGIGADVLIAAQARQHDAVVITRNERHFQCLGVKYEGW